METEDNIVTLPPELLLLTFEHLHAVDLCRASLVCNVWKAVGVTPSLWRNLALLRWHLWRGDISDIDDWKGAYVDRNTKDTTMATLLREVRKIPERRVSARQELVSMGVEVVDALRGLLVRLAAFPCAHFDTKFHAERMLAKIQEGICLQKWDDLLRKPEQERRVEDGAILVCLLEYPDLDLNDLYEQLDTIAARLKVKIQTEGGGTEDPLDMLQLLSEYLFHDMGIHGNTDNYYDPKNSFLNDVIARKTGIPVSLSVLYAAIARRIGVKVEMVGMPTHFLVKWVSPSGSETFIDPFGGGRFLTADQCQQIAQNNDPGIVFQNSFLSSVRSFDVWPRMLRNLTERYKVLGHLEKWYAVVSVMFKLTRVPHEILSRAKNRILHEDYDEALDDMRLLVDLQVQIPLETLNRGVLDKLQQSQVQIVPKIKPQEVKFNIGDVFVHKELGYHAVIFGWDAKCMMSVEWQEQVGVNLLQHGGNQPFYKCFRHTDGRVWSFTYVPQENIAGRSSVQIEHPFIGKYFKKFDPVNCRFIPTKEMQHKYPS